MASGFAERQQSGNFSQLQKADAILRPLLGADRIDRSLRSVRYQMHVARCPIYRDLAGFDFSQSRMDRRQIEQFATHAEGLLPRLPSLINFQRAGPVSFKRAVTPKADSGPPDPGVKCARGAT